MPQVTNHADNIKDNIDREVEFLLKEYETMRNESLTREASRAQIGSVTIILIGGIMTIVPFLFFEGSHGLQLKIPLSYAIFMLLVSSLLFTSLQWAYLLHDFEVSHIANYIQTLRVRACQLLDLKRDSAQILGWDIYHTRKLYQTSKYAFFSVVMLNISRYAIITIPALISLLIAGWLYFSHFSLLTMDVIGITILLFFVFDTLYFLVFFTTAFYCLGMYQDLTTIPKELDRASHTSKQPYPGK